MEFFMYLEWYVKSQIFLYSQERHKSKLEKIEVANKQES